MSSLASLPPDPMEIGRWMLAQLNDAELAARYHCDGDGSGHRCRTEQRLWYICRSAAHALFCMVHNAGQCGQDAPENEPEVKQ